MIMTSLVGQGVTIDPPKKPPPKKQSMKDAQ